MERVSLSSPRSVLLGLVIPHSVAFQKSSIGGEPNLSLVNQTRGNMTHLDVSRRNFNCLNLTYHSLIHHNLSHQSLTYLEKLKPSQSNLFEPNPS